MKLNDLYEAFSPKHPGQRAADIEVTETNLDVILRKLSKNAELSTENKTCYNTKDETTKIYLNKGKKSVKIVVGHEVRKGVVQHMGDQVGTDHYNEFKKKMDASSYTFDMKDGTKQGIVAYAKKLVSVFG